MHDEEDDEGYDEEINNELKKQFIEKSKREFVAG